MRNGEPGKYIIRCGGPLSQPIRADFEPKQGLSAPFSCLLTALFPAILSKSGTIAAWTVDGAVLGMACEEHQRFRSSQRHLTDSSDEETH